jgi:hypothetical protein
MALQNEYAIAPATSFSDTSANGISSINPSFVAHIHSTLSTYAQQQYQQTQNQQQHHQQHPQQQQQHRHHLSVSEQRGEISVVQPSAVVFSYRNSTSSYTRRVQSAHQLAQSQLQHLLKQAQSLLPSGAGNVTVVLPLHEPVDCTEIEEYYEEERPDYADYVRRWEEAKDAEQRAMHAPDGALPRVERSLFFGLAQEQAIEAAKIAQSDGLAALVVAASSSSSSSSSPGCSSSVTNMHTPCVSPRELTIDTAAASFEQQGNNLNNTDSNNEANSASVLAGSMTPVQLPARTHGINVSPVLQGATEQQVQQKLLQAQHQQQHQHQQPLLLKHIAQTSLLSFMAELVAESEAIGLAQVTEAAEAAARASATASPSPSSSAYLAALQSSSARSVGHVRSGGDAAGGSSSNSPLPIDQSLAGSSSSNGAVSGDRRDLIAPPVRRYSSAHSQSSARPHGGNGGGGGRHSRKASATLMSKSTGAPIQVITMS